MLHTLGWKGSALKTLHFNNYWHKTSGGVAQFYKALMAAANRAGHEMRLVVPDERSWVEEVGEHCKIYHVAAPPAPLDPGYRLIYPTQFLQGGTSLQTILLAEQPDLVEICDKYTLNYLGALLRIRGLKDISFRPVVVGTSHERMDDNFRTYLASDWLSAAFCRWYMRWIYFPFFDHHIANSRYTAEELVPAGDGLPERRGIWVRPPGVDFAHLSPQLRSAQVRARLELQAGVPAGATLLLYVGRLAAEKNLPLLIETMKQLAAQPGGNYYLLVVGQGVERDNLARTAESVVPGRVKLLGHLADRAALAEMYANCDVFVHPNPREPFGIAPLEAMASGLPLVAPNSGGVMTYASSENAWIAEPTGAAFAAAIVNALDDAETRHRKRAAALATAENFRWEVVADRFLHLLQEMGKTIHSSDVAEPADFVAAHVSQTSTVMTRVVSGTAKRIFAAASRLKLIPSRAP